jgi:peptidoglycan/LPS O-acetylase OafA/YrhL
VSKITNNQQPNNPLQSNLDLKRNRQLDALRGILAICIVLVHVEIYQYHFDRPSPYFSFAVYNFGQIVVAGFFVLSGYFITLSILKAKATNTLRASVFYRRRAFRILPVYYLLIFSAVFVFPSIDLLKYHLPATGGITFVKDNPSYYWHYLFVMPQVPLLRNYILPFAEITWSIGVEELFYLVIPWLFLKSKKNITSVLVVFIIVFNLLKTYQFYVNASHTSVLLLNSYMYDCIALGCLVAIMHVNENKLFRYINKTWHVLVTLIVFALMFSRVTVGPMNYLPYATCFAIFITYLANNNSAMKIPNWLVYIGKISYSLYLCHSIVIVLGLNLELDKNHFLVFYSVCIASAVALASALHYAVEKPFIKLGARFTLTKQSLASKGN